MIFSSLSNKLQETFKKLKSKGKLTEQDIDSAMREIRLSLLEADVNFKVVKSFITELTNRCIGVEVSESLTPGQLIVKIVHEELIALMGRPEKIVISPKPPTIIMMVGLQGTGKTTTVSKLGYYYQKQGKKPLLVAADTYRPAAIDQLKVLGESLKLSVYTENASPVEICRNAIDYANKYMHDMVILDTAGRLHIDDDMMNELKAIKEAVNPGEILIVVDAMTGQDAVNVAKEFDEKIGLTGIVMTKMDGDTRGGAVLSVRYVTGKPVKFVGVGEKSNQFESFEPERMASRILGMGDMLGLIEKAQENFDAQEASKLNKKLKDNKLDLNDYLQQMQQMKKMGSFKQIIDMLPSVGGLKQLKQLKDVDVDEKQISHIEAIIQSMTMEERSNPSIINGSRKRRIAKGSGTDVPTVNRLLNQFEQTQKMLKQFGGGHGGKKKHAKKSMMSFLK